MKNLQKISSEKLSSRFLYQSHDWNKEVGSSSNSKNAERKAYYERVDTLSESSAERTQLVEKIKADPIQFDGRKTSIVLAERFGELKTGNTEGKNWGKSSHKKTFNVLNKLTKMGFNVDDASWWNGRKLTVNDDGTFDVSGATTSSTPTPAPYRAPVIKETFSSSENGIDTNLELGGKEVRVVYGSNGEISHFRVGVQDIAYSTRSDKPGIYKLEGIDASIRLNGGTWEIVSSSLPSTSTSASSYMGTFESKNNTTNVEDSWLGNYEDGDVTNTVEAPSASAVGGGSTAFNDANSAISGFASAL